MTAERNDRDRPPLRTIDAVTVPVPDLDSGLAFYSDRLGHRVLWRNDAVGQAGLQPPDSDGELVLTVAQEYEPNWLVQSADRAADAFVAAGGRVVAPAFDGPVGRITVVADPFGNRLVLLDLSAGRYAATDARSTETVGGVRPTRSRASPQVATIPTAERLLHDSLPRCGGRAPSR